MSAPLVGVFVGGKSTRMQGMPKGLLLGRDGRTLLERARGVLRSAWPDVEIVLVGDAGPYATEGLATLRDDPPGIGPLGGLCALIAEGERRGSEVIALACDLPYFTPELLQRLAAHAPGSGAVLAFPEGVYQPLFARYHPRALAAARAAVEAGERALYRVAERLGKDLALLPLSADDVRLLVDWDTPGDVDT